MSEPASTPRQLFLSYSRTEMYYAEAVTLHLQRLGYNVWFDLQQLEPGCNWREEIDAGLANSDEILLIASRAALQSYWVTHEWQSALAADKPLHIIAFEELSFDPVTVAGEDEKPKTVDLAVMRDTAQTLIDGRADFMGTMRRLDGALSGDAPNRDDIPAPNRFHIPMRLPITVATVAGALVLGVLVLAWFTLAAAIIYPPMALGGALLTYIVGRELMAFITRQSYRGARTTLVLLTLVTALIAPVLALVFLAATVIALFAKDMNRWSPRGEGIRRATDTNRDLFARFGPMLLYRWYRNIALLMKLIIIILVFLLGLLGGFFIPALETTFWVPAAFLLVLTIISLVDRIAFSGRRKRNTPPQEPNGKTFRVIATPEDDTIKNRVEQALREAGYTNLRNRPEPVDFNILIATNHLEAANFRSADTSEGRWIVLVASHLEEADWFERVENFQWVDFRKQDAAQLRAMIEDLSQANYDIVSHSFSTRVVPQSFQKIIMPRRVQLYILFQLVLLNIQLVVGVRLFVSDMRFDPLVGLTLIIGAVSTVVAIWIITRIVRREITTERIIGINLTVQIIATIIGWVYGLMQPLPFGYVRNEGAIMVQIIVTIIGWIIGYYLGNAILRRWLGQWLPLSFGEELTLFSWQRDRNVLQRNLVTATLVIILSLTVLVGPVERSTVEGPVEEVPLAGVLRQVNTGVAQSVANAIDGAAGVRR